LWDNDEFFTITAAKKQTVGILLSTPLLVRQDNDSVSTQCSTRKKQTVGIHTFNTTSTWPWDNDGTQPAAPEKQTVGILLLSTPLLVLG
jgi:hypothetical protein